MSHGAPADEPALFVLDEELTGGGGSPIAGSALSPGLGGADGYGLYVALPLMPPELLDDEDMPGIGGTAREDPLIIADRPLASVELNDWKSAGVTLAGSLRRMLLLVCLIPGVVVPLLPEPDGTEYDGVLPPGMVEPLPLPEKLEPLP